MHNHAALNRIYRLVWSHVNSCWVAVAETAKGHGKSAVRRKLLALVALALAPVAAHAGLEGGVIVGGQGSIVNPNLVIQNSARLAINAMGFSVGAGEIFNLQQQSASDMALIRVLGQNPSDIFGTINAKGQLLLSNPNGILFGKDSQVNVGGLIATTLNIDAADFMLGNYNFFKNKKKLGAVVNQGILTAADGGYIALLSPEVRNEGVVSARLGSAALLAGDKVTLNLNEGALVSYAIDQGAVNALAENKQLIQADGGQVFMGAKAANSLTTAVINNTGIIRARTVQNQDGKIMLMGDMQVGAINVGGTLDASAPIELNPNGGSGGFIETSAAHVKVADSAKVTTLAATGSNGTHQNGTWLIDPNDFTISTTGDMSGAAVSAALAGGNFTIQTTSMGTAGGNGDIFVNEAVNWNTNNTFTLNAERNININADITATGATGKLSLLYGQASAAGGTNDNYFIDSANGVKVNLQAGDNFSTQKGSAGTVINYTVITDLGAAGSMTGIDLQGMNGDLTKNYALGADIDATATSGWGAWWSDGFGHSSTGFKPIGAGGFEGASFTGNFDGLGHVVQNLTVSTGVSTNYYTGLFGNIQSLGPVLTIQNIGLVNGSITNLGGWSTGSLAGYLDGYSGGVVIRNAFADNVRVEWGGSTGGLIGDAWGNVTIDQSHVIGSMAVKGWRAMGGLLGTGGDNLKITSSYATVDVIGDVDSDTRYIGGLVGDIYDYDGGSISDSYATGNVSGAGETGGLVGRIQGGSLYNNHATGTVTGTPFFWGNFYIGGLVGYASETNISNNYATGNVTATGAYGVGGLVGSARFNTLIDHSNATGRVTGLSSATAGGASVYGGGLVGELSNSSITNSYASGNVDGGVGSYEFGGLVGDLTEGVISDSYATGAVTGDQYVGGLVALAWMGQISNSYATGAVSGNSFIGGLAGTYRDAASNLSITDSYASGSVVGTGDYVGGLVGQFYSDAPGATITFTGNQYTGTTVTGRDYVGGIIGSMTANATSTLSTMDGYNVTANISGRDYVGGLIGKNGGDTNHDYRGFDIINSSHAGTVTAIGTGASTGSSAIVDGASHIAGSGDFAGGLVGHNYNASITNSWTSGDVSATGTYAGGLVGRYDSNMGLHPIITGSHATGNVAGRAFVGGLAGETFFVDVSNSYATGNLSGTQNINSTADLYVGGLVGYSYQGSFTNTYALGNVTGGSQVGGLIGMNDSSTITQSRAEGNVTGAWRVGGLVGRNYGLVTDSYARGNVTGVDTTGLGGDMFGDDVGGLVGVASANDLIHTYAVGAVSGHDRVGGLVGYILGGRSVRESYVMNASVAGNNMVGGLVGANQGALFKLGIIDSYADSPVTGNDRVGGLVGYNGGASGTEQPGKVTRSYAAGLVTGNTNIGGLIGDHYTLASLPTDSYWNTETTGQATSAGGAGAVGKTTAEMQVLATFTNWDIDSTGGTSKVWRIYEGQTAPLLRYFLNPLTITANSATKTYDGLAYSGGNGVTYSTPPLETLYGSAIYGGAAQGAVNAGSYTIAAANNSYFSAQYSGFNQLKQNYDISYVGGTLTITPAPLLVTANNATKTYNGQAYSGGNGVTYSGFVNGETSSVLAGSLSYGGSSQGAVNPGVYGITASGFTNGNYAISYVPSSLAITYTTPIDTSPVLSVAYHGAKDISSGICTVNGLSGAEAYVQVMNNRFALTEVALYELDANEVVADTNQLKLTSNCMCDDTNRSFKDVDVTVLDGGVRMPDNRLSSYQNQEDIEIIKTPRVIRSRSAL